MEQTMREPQWPLSKKITIIYKINEGKIMTNGSLSLSSV